MIKVFIIDDLESARNLIRDMLETDPEIHICGMADNEMDAIKMVLELRPDLIILDSKLRQTSGYEVAQQIMQVYPARIIMVIATSEAPVEGSKALFECGVLEIIKKGDLYRWRTRPEVAAGFIRKIKLISKVSSQFIKTKCEKTEKKPRAVVLPLKPSADKHWSAKREHGRVIAIVSSTGGPNALSQVIGGLPRDFPAPILIVQHMSPGFIDGLAEWLDQQNHIRVRVAKQDSPIVPGEALLAPDRVHLTIGGNRHIDLLDTPPIGGHRPSGNMLLKSVAETYGSKALGVILTGMGNDGSEGMATLKKAGGRSIVQDQASSVVFGMPRSVIALGLADRILPLEQIASAIARFAKNGF